ncbi:MULTISPECIES: GntR family transcriptional regulator [Desulfosporosinus]|uniref:DNA-binding transcriptional regulator, GntR family n=2 Tax=Desulfosporosinus TaxID=79206 RepID=A0A1G7WX45_9FIRM|nr:MULTISPECIES: GntR family transcriptional regulator [Desulfosporosinus]AFQ42156.1 transcriptional regulator [Desulfosporosinus meridiei DSM 13257]SDG76492.1 DNA-binding transcriptional regulator, GntR family [Desulfosporosinus hippei DSM 8344]
MGKRLLPVILDGYKPLREIVFESMRDAILSGVLEPGERLMEIQLAEEMGVSRTPVREAIRKLELENFVVMIPRKGAYVAGVSSKDVADVFEIRSALEGLAAGLAAERITEDELEQMERVLFYRANAEGEMDLEQIVKSDTDFHALVYSASRNERLIQILANLREQIQRFRATSLAVPGRNKLALEEHRMIVEALRKHDSEEAQSLAMAHIVTAENVMFDVLSIKNEPDKVDK